MMLSFDRCMLPAFSAFSTTVTAVRAVSAYTQFGMCSRASLMNQCRGG